MINDALFDVWFLFAYHQYHHYTVGLYTGLVCFTAVVTVAVQLDRDKSCETLFAIHSLRHYV